MAGVRQARPRLNEGPPLYTTMKILTRHKLVVGAFGALPIAVLLFQTIGFFGFQGTPAALERGSDARADRGGPRTITEGSTLSVSPFPARAEPTATPTPTTPQQPQNTNSQSGQASYYAYKPGGCAHKSIPKGTVVTVTNVATDKSTTCVVNDRGPFVAGRIIDLDTRVFTQLASTSGGVFRARISW